MINHLSAGYSIETTVETIVLLAGIATVGTAFLEWKAFRKRRWFLPEGILWSLVAIALLVHLDMSAAVFLLPFL